MGSWVLCSREVEKRWEKKGGPRKRKGQSLSGREFFFRRRVVRKEEKKKFFDFFHLLHFLLLDIKNSISRLWLFPPRFSPFSLALALSSCEEPARLSPAGRCASRTELGGSSDGSRMLHLVLFFPRRRRRRQLWKTFRRFHVFNLPTPLSLPSALRAPFGAELSRSHPLDRDAERRKPRP